MNGFQILPIDQTAIVYRAQTVAISISDEGYLVAPRGGDGFRIVAPKIARELFALCLTIVDWFPKSEWRVLYVNPFNGFGILESYQLKRLVFGPEHAIFNRDCPDGILFHDCSADHEKANLVIADVIMCVLLHEGHIELFFEGAVGEYVGVQDGIVYFNAAPERIRQIRSAAEDLKGNPMRFPAWTLEVYARYQ